MREQAWKGITVLVTGAAGFIGSHLVEALVERGAIVIGVDLIDEPWRLRHVLQDITYVPADLGEWDGNEASDASPEVVFHLAAFSMPSAAQREPGLALRQNVMATARALELARRWGVRKFLFTSAGALYTNQPRYVPIDEQHPIDPSQGVYTMTKRLGELLCEDAHRLWAVPTMYMRLFNTYGPRQSTDFLIPSLVAQARREGRVTVRTEAVQRDFVYVSDAVEALLAGAWSGWCGGPVNVGTGIEHSIGEVGRKIAALLGVGAECLNEPAFGPVRQVCDARLARRLLGWEPARTLDEGLALTVRALTDEQVQAGSAVQTGGHDGDGR